MDHKREYWRYGKGSFLRALVTEACEMSKHVAADLVSGLFDLPGKMAVERSLAEFRAGRPVLFAAESSVIGVPVDALDAERLHSFIGTFARRSDALPLRLARILLRCGHVLLQIAGIPNCALPGPSAYLLACQH